MRRRTLVLGSVGLLACRSEPAPDAPSSAGHIVVYVVRHAEKVVEGGVDDPPLTSLGLARARALPAVLDVDGLVAIYSTDTRRTRATVAPVARAAGLAITSYEATDHAGLLSRIRAHGSGRVVVAGHSNTIPDMLVAFGVEDAVTIGDDQYGDVFEVELGPRGVVLRRGRFEPSGDRPR